VSGVRLTEEQVQVPGPGDGQMIRAVVLRPVGDRPWPGLLFYSDIFQLTPSTLRTARRLASAGFVLVAPEVYPHGELAGVALAFDDDGKRRGQAGADATSTASFDDDRDAVLSWLEGRPDTAGAPRAAGFCLGGHLAFRAALDPRVVATACFYPTGLQDGKLGADPADSLATASDIRGALMLVFGSRDPHVPAVARQRVLAELERQGIEPEVHVYAGEHAFMRDEGPRHDPALTDAALAAAVAFLVRA